MGEHQALTTERVGHRQARSRTSWRRPRITTWPTAWDEGFFDDLVTPYLGVTKDALLRPDTSVEKLAALKPAFGGADGTMTAGNSTALSDGAAIASCSASAAWAERTTCPCWRASSTPRWPPWTIPAAPTCCSRPVAAAGRLLARQGLTVDDFDLVEIHEAFASTVLATLAAWESDEYCRGVGLDGAIGSLDRSRLNVAGSSLAAGHPFAATGARIVPTLAKLLHQTGPGRRGLISVCAAGGLGVVAILEAV